MEARRVKVVGAERPTLAREEKGALDRRKPALYIAPACDHRSFSPFSRERGPDPETRNWTMESHRPSPPVPVR